MANWVTLLVCYLCSIPITGHIIKSDVCLAFVALESCVCCALCVLCVCVLRLQNFNECFDFA